MRLLPLPWLLLVAGILLTVVALARPVQHVPLPHESEGIDIMLCLDTSSSMTGSDMDPQRTRLDVARDAAVRFIAGRPNDRIGLICFARFPDLRCPPTPDHGALRRFLDAGVPVTLATDNPTVSATSLTEEYMLAIARLGLSQEEVDALIAAGRQAAFVVS